MGATSSVGTHPLFIEYYVIESGRYMVEYRQLSGKIFKQEMSGREVKDLSRRLGVQPKLVQRPVFENCADLVSTIQRSLGSTAV